MTDFKTYYNQQFKIDLLNFLEQIPVEGNKHYSKEQSFIQYFFLTPYYSYLDIISDKRRANFIVSLFWVVLIDQVCYSSYKSSYYFFKLKTNYPKFIGNCTAPSLMASQCGHNQHPHKILLAVNDYVDTGNTFEFDKKPFELHESKIKRQGIELNKEISESIPIVQEEISAYFTKYHPEIDSAKFWQYCLSELYVFTQF